MHKYKIQNTNIQKYKYAKKIQQYNNTKIQNKKTKNKKTKI